MFTIPRQRVIPTSDFPLDFWRQNLVPITTVRILIAGILNFRMFWFSSLKREATVFCAGYFAASSNLLIRFKSLFANLIQLEIAGNMVSKNSLPSRLARIAFKAGYDWLNLGRVVERRWFKYRAFLSLLLPFFLKKLALLRWEWSLSLSHTQNMEDYKEQRGFRW